MTVKELRVLVDSLDEYIRIPHGIERLKKTILHLAFSGQLVPQEAGDGSGEDLFARIKSEKDRLQREGKIKKQKSFPEITEPRYVIPENWKWVHLADITNLITDGTHHTPKYQSHGVPFLSIKDVSGGILDFSNTKYISEDEHREINQRCNPEVGDILFCRIGTLGKPVIVNTVEPFSIFVSLGLIKFNQDNVLPEFLKLYLEAPDTYKQYREIMAGGSHTNKLNLVSMNALEVVLPPLKEQQRIVDRLKHAMDIISELEDRYKAEQVARSKFTASTLSKMVNEDDDSALRNFKEIIKTDRDVDMLESTILSLAIRGKLIPQSPSDDTGEKLYHEILAEKAREVRSGKIKRQKELPSIADSEVPFKIPKTWHWVRLGEITNYGTSLKAKPKDIPNDAWLLDLEDIEKDSSVLLKRITASERNSTSDKNVFSKNDVLYGKLRPYLNKVIIANEQGYSTSELLPINIHGGLGSPKYLMFTLKSPYFGEYVNNITYGVKMPRLGTEDGRKAVVPLPPLKEQLRIAEKIDEVFVLTKHLRSLVTQ